MVMCSKCHEKVAVVFVTKNVNGKMVQEGYCLSCAGDLGIQPINDMLKQTGMSEDELASINEQMGGLMEGIESGEISFQDLLKDGGLQIGGVDASGNIFNVGGGMNLLSPDGMEDDMDEPPMESNIMISPKEGKNNRHKNEPPRKSKIKKKFLKTYGTNLTEKARLGGIDKVVGRQAEIERVIQILNRRSKNNPCLIGEPGVGKTAIAEGLAVKIAEGNVPFKLADAEVYQLDMTAVVAGTQFRGQFESRMKGIIDEASQAGNIILVIDEIHNIVGAGDSEGSMNAANILKPALSRGEIQIVGATTLDEYRKQIEKDSALERRFQPVMVDEPSVADSIEILKGIRGYYEDYHRVNIDDDVIEYAVNLSERYITDRFLPDKAIDVIDEAGSILNLHNRDLEKLADLQKQKEKLLNELDNANDEDGNVDFQKVADIKVRECKIEEEIEQLCNKENYPHIQMSDVAKVIESWTKIPVQKITETEAGKLINLEERLHESIIGQDKAVKAVARTIRRTRSGFRKKKKPASFIFIGPTGVGKTELVRVLARELFESEDSLIRLDMSEYMEKHTVSKLIGSPPGYVGYDDAGQLTEKVRRKPYSVVLLDEIEKAHADVFNMLLQILDDGRLTDSHGRVVNFENTVIIMTSNAGAHLKSGALGFSSDPAESMAKKQNDVLKETFRPEFLNRIDEIIVFDSLKEEELKQIIRLMLREVVEEALSNGIELQVDDSAIDFIFRKGYDMKYGARPLRRTIQEYIEDELAEMYLSGLIAMGSKVQISYVDGEEVLRFGTGAKKQISAKKG